MQIIDYFQADDQSRWLTQIAACEWRAAKFLAELLTKGEFNQAVGSGTVFLLIDGDKLVSFVSLAERDCVDAPDFTPWIGFVHTAPEYRGHRHVGKLLDHACAVAHQHGAARVYLDTDHVGLYEKYGFTYLENRVDINGEDSRIYVRETAAPVDILPLTLDNFHADSLDTFIRRQVVTECWRNIGGQWQLRPIAFIDDWESPRRKTEQILDAIRQGNPVIGAFARGRLVGFAMLGERLGSRGQYIDLSSLHVSEPWRGQGIGRRLFAAACDAARALGADKLYISAHSAKESQAAYRALGCVHAAEVDPAHAAKEPCDVQMEYDLRKATIRFGTMEDLPSWMALVRRVAWNFPGLETEEALQEHAGTVSKFMKNGNAICAVIDDEVIGVLLFSRRLNMLCCMAVAPEFRRRGVAQGMFDLMLTLADSSRDLTVTTFREDDPKGDAPRAFYQKNGFFPSELIVENDYPCQVFIRRGSRG